MSATLKQRRALLLAVDITYWGYKLTYELDSMFAILVIKFNIFICNQIQWQIQANQDYSKTQNLSFL